MDKNKMNGQQQPVDVELCKKHIILDELLFMLQMCVKY